jgi:hypothetical protein
MPITNLLLPPASMLELWGSHRRHSYATCIRTRGRLAPTSVNVPDPQVRVREEVERGWGESSEPHRVAIGSQTEIVAHLGEFTEGCILGIVKSAKFMPVLGRSPTMCIRASRSRG